MINLVGHEGEEQTGHLAESEVAHLLSTLQNAEFTRSETRNLQKDKSFKPRSLIEIASAAQARETEVKLAGAVANQAVDITDLADELTDTVAQNTLKSSSNNDPDVSISENLSPDQSTLESTVFPLNTLKTLSTSDPDVPTSENLSPDQSTLESTVFPLTANKIVDEESNNNKVPETTLASEAQIFDLQGTSDQSSEELAAAGDEQNGQISVGFETANEAFERGKAEGIIEGRETAIVEIKAAAELEARAELADKVSAFEEGLAALTKPQALQVETLAKSIQATVLRLASERAGSQIDDMPEDFVNRIDALTCSIGKKINEGQVQLNSDDYALVIPFFPNTTLDFVANPDLKRGDIVLRFDGIELRDVAEKRTDNNYTSEMNWEPVGEEMTSDQAKADATIDDPSDALEAGLDVSSDVLNEPDS
jgi:flagellar biosynthesis/type III secretory pathway protein FliH